MENLPVKSISVLPVKGLNENYKWDVQHFNRWTDGRALSKDLIVSYFEEQRADRTPPRTIARRKCAIKKALKQMKGGALSLQEMAQLDSFFKDLKTGTASPAKSQEDVLTAGELKALIKAAGPKTGLIIRALYETAARVTELVSIKMSDCQVRKDGVIITTIGKGNKEGAFFMSLDLFNDIKAAYQSGEYLFQVRETHIDRRTVYYMIKRAGAKIGRSDVHPHTLRHTWASLSIPVLGLSKVSAYLRHADTSTTARFYLHGRASIEEVKAVNALTLAGE